LQDEKGKTALHYAAASKQPQLIEVLKRFDADPNIQDNDGCTPLHISVAGISV
jgi:ankyrin repeat protein